MIDPTQTVLMDFLQELLEQEDSHISFCVLQDMPYFRLSISGPAVKELPDPIPGLLQSTGGAALLARLLLLAHREEMTCMAEDVLPSEDAEIPPPRVEIAGSRTGTLEVLVSPFWIQRENQGLPWPEAPESDASGMEEFRIPTRRDERKHARASRSFRQWIRSLPRASPRAMNAQL